MADARYCISCGEVYLESIVGDRGTYGQCVVWKGRLDGICLGQLAAMPAADAALVLAAFALGGWDAVASLGGGKFSPPDERDGGQAVYRP